MKGQRGERRRTTKGSNEHFDLVFFVVVVFLMAFGLLIIYSASSYEAGIKYGNPAHFLKLQARNILIGSVLMFIAYIIPCDWIHKCDFLIGPFGIGCILLVLVPGLGVTVNGATRWLDLKIFNVQPAEITKVCVILFVASMIVRIGKANVNKPKEIIAVLFVPLVCFFLIYFVTKNLSSAIIVLGIAITMLFVASPNYKGFFVAGFALLLMGAGVILYAIYAPEVEGFRMIRVQAWLYPEKFSTDKAFQTLQSLYAIGSGGLWGKGLGQSMQKMGFVPEAQNDMIFAILCEELGLFGAVTVIFLFIVLIWSCMIIANHTEDLYGSLVVVGIMAHFALQAILNIAVVTNTIPNTGITLPFISYGGSAIVFLMIEVGLVLNISRGGRRKPNKSKRNKVNENSESR